MYFRCYDSILHKGPSINYVVSVKGGGSPKDDLLNRPYLIKKTTRGGGGKTLPILRQHSLWTAPYRIHIPGYQLHLVAEKILFTP